MLRHALPGRSTPGPDDRAPGGGTVVRRLFDVAGAALLLGLFAPALLLVAVGLRAEREGPVLARRRVVGGGGREFDLLRFRCFRATPFGRMLRATGIAEMPTLLNVLRGEMSLVGPDPVSREELMALPSNPTAMPRPGLIGW
jgi:lipopolysaccharide/colanic/teichoic acid biosynthesis glycosyltransferase